ncbi:MAG: Gldg family protein, partial [Planctomycetota bacterium]
MTQRPSKTPSANGRRARFMAQSLILILLSFVAAVLLPSVVSGRFDLSNTGSQSLAPSTEALLDQLDEPITIAVTLDTTRLTGDQRRRTVDLLDAFEAASPLVTVERIDPKQPESAEAQVKLVLDALESQQSSIIEAHQQSIRNTRSTYTSVSEAIESLAAAIEANTAIDRANAANAAAALRQSVVLPSLSSEANLNRLTNATRTPEADALRSVIEILNQIITAFENAASTGLLEPNDPLLTSAISIRDEAGAVVDAAANLPPMRAAQIERALREDEALVILGEREVVAAPASQLIPSDTPSRLFGEELVITAIDAVTNPNPPTVVLMHAESQRLLDESGEPTRPARDQLGALLERLRLKRWTLLEWQTATDPIGPTANDDNTVYFVMSSPSLAEASQGSLAMDRTDRLARAITTVLEDGSPLLVTLQPSTRPAIGSEDPIAALLMPFGINANTDRMLIENQTTPRGTNLIYNLTALPSTSEHPVANALANTSFGTRSAIPLEFTDDGVSALLTIPHSAQRWAETRWVSAIARRTATPDANDTTEGPYTIAAAAEREWFGKKQRLIAVGSTLWFTNTLYGSPDSPANAELAEAALNW